MTDNQPASNHAAYIEGGQGHVLIFLKTPFEEGGVEMHFVGDDVETGYRLLEVNTIGINMPTVSVEAGNEVTVGMPLVAPMGDEEVAILERNSIFVKAAAEQIDHIIEITNAHWSRLLRK